MIDNFKKDIYTTIDQSNLISLFSVVYAKALNIDQETAEKIVQKKFEKHIESVDNKFKESIANETFKNVSPDKDINVEEYLNKKPIIKG